MNSRVCDFLKAARESEYFFDNKYGYFQLNWQSNLKKQDFSEFLQFFHEFCDFSHFIAENVNFPCHSTKLPCQFILSNKIFTKMKNRCILLVTRDIMCYSERAT